MDSRFLLVASATCRNDKVLVETIGFDLGRETCQQPLYRSIDACQNKSESSL